jgi:hypothetical protein
MLVAAVLMEWVKRGVLGKTGEQCCWYRYCSVFKMQICGIVWNFPLRLDESHRPLPDDRIGAAIKTVPWSTRYLRRAAVAVRR